jgi:hypothetical protein
MSSYLGSTAYALILVVSLVTRKILQLLSWQDILHRIVRSVIVRSGDDRIYFLPIPWPWHMTEIGQPQTSCRNVDFEGSIS